MKAVVVKEPGVVDVIDVAPPQAGPYQALVRTRVASLCNGTDGKLVSGAFPDIDRYPLALGHESAGTVEVIGDSVRNFALGDTAISGLVLDFEEDIASAWGGFCEYTLVNDHQAMVDEGVAGEADGWLEVFEIQRALDADIALPEAVLMCTWREVVGAFEDFRLKAGQRVLIVGGGPVGLSFVKFARLLGLAWVGLVDRHAAKREKAIELGAHQVFAPDELAAFTRQNARSLDAVIDAVGKEEIIDSALPLVRMGGSVCVYGVITADSLHLAKSAGPHNFNVFVHQWPTRRYEAAAQGPLTRWIREGSLRASDFVTHEFAIEQIDEALAAIQAGDAIKCLLHY